MKKKKSQRRLHPLFLILFFLVMGLLLLIFLRRSFVTEKEQQKVIDISLPIIPKTVESAPASASSVQAPKAVPVEQSFGREF
ncbi:hypothetical protein HYS96_00130 [Candidatus Daviesbacteria bacterium]|nr:hypothetical protein [Candidatus Daviesbacteria bacterium]